MKRNPTKKTFVYLTVLMIVAMSQVAYALDTSILRVDQSLLDNAITNEIRESIRVISYEASLEMVGDDTLSVGSTTVASVWLDPGEYSVNTASLYVSYDPLMIELAAIENASSSFALSFTEINDHEEGVVVAHYFHPYPGIYNESLVVNMIIRAKSSGTTTISFSSNTKVLANDGYGTNVLASTTSYSLTID